MSNFLGPFFHFFVVKKIFYFFFDHKKLKKPPSKVAHNRPKPFLRQSSPGHSPQPRSSFPFYKKPNPNVSLLVSEPNATLFFVSLCLYSFQYDQKSIIHRQDLSNLNSRKISRQLYSNIFTRAFAANS